MDPAPADPTATSSSHPKLTSKRHHAHRGASVTTLTKTPTTSFTKATRG